MIAHLQASPQWKNMVVVVTYDENGGFWDHAAPPNADRWGLGTRIPALIVSPYAKKGFVDHAVRHEPILRFITRRFAAAPRGPATARRRAEGQRRAADGRPDERAATVAEPVTAWRLCNEPAGAMPATS